MKIIDMHCDTMWKLEKVENGCQGQTPRKETLYKNTGHVDIDGMQQAGTTAQFFANFIYMDAFEFDWEKGYAGALKMIERSKKEIENSSKDMQFLASYKQLQDIQEQCPRKIGAFLTIEEGGILNDKMERLWELYQQGIRLMTLTWNYENCIGFPNSEDSKIMNQGLKPFGIELIEEMNRLGMMIDVSHLSDGGFWDVVQHSNKPVTASHSNCRALCNVRRNLTDDMLKALGEQGGVAGINFFPYFTKEDGICRASDLAAHVVHMMDVGGEELPAIGTDFDGYDMGESDLHHVREMELFYDALKKVGLTVGQIEKLCYNNAARLMEENI